MNKIKTFIKSDILMLSLEVRYVEEMVFWQIKLMYDHFNILPFRVAVLNIIPTNFRQKLKVIHPKAYCVQGMLYIDKIKKDIGLLYEDKF